MEQMTVLDIVMSPDFAEAFTAIKNEIREHRIKSGYHSFKRGPLERLQERAEFNAKDFPELYLGVLDGSLNSGQYPSTVRAYIKLVGDEAYRRAYGKIIERIATVQQAPEKSQE